MTFYIGQKVVRIAPTGRPTSRMIVGNVYTISDIIPVGRGLPDALLFTEVDVSFTRVGRPLGWKCTNYKPLVDKPTDISIFTEMLNTTNLELVK